MEKFKNSNVKFYRTLYKGKIVYMGLYLYKNELYKCRCSIVVYNDEKIYFGIDPEAGRGWFPGGSCDVNDAKNIPYDISGYLAGIVGHETEEELGITVNNIVNTNYTVFLNYKKKNGARSEVMSTVSMPQIVDENNKIDTKKEIVGGFSIIFIAKYMKPYTGKVAKRDQSSHFMKNGKFYYYHEIRDGISDTYQKAIETYLPNIAQKFEKSEEGVLDMKIDNIIHNFLK